jgi:hypothetical protein
MIREKRLSPRRAKSRLPLSPRANSRLRLKPLLFLRPLPLQRRHTKKARLARFCTHYEYPLFDARPEGFSELGPPTADVVSSHGAAPAQECRLRLKQIPPNASRRCPPLKSSTPCSGLLLLRLFAPCSNVNCVSVLETKIAPRLIFLSKTESKRFSGEKGRTKANGPTETVTAIQLNNKR